MRAPAGTACGVNFALFSEGAESVELCLFDASGRHEVKRLALREHTDHVWHGYLPQARPGHAVRLSCPWPIPPRGRPALQPAQAADRPVRARRSSAACAGATRCSATASATRIWTCRSTGATARRACRSCKVIEPAFTWGDDRAPNVPWQRHSDLRAARARLHAAASRRAAGVARHLRRPGLRTGDRIPAAPGRDDGRAAAHAFVRRRTAADRARPEQLLGLQHHRLLRVRTSATWRRARSTNSRPWCARCTPPAWRWCWTWSTTTPQKATSWGPRWPFAASTTARTTA